MRKQKVNPAQLLILMFAIIGLGKMITLHYCFDFFHYGRKALQDRHKRQLRKFKTDELRSGLATVAGAYHALVVSQPTPSNSDVYIQAIERIHKAMGVLGLNVNEELVLQSLFLQCPSLMQMPHIAPVN